MVILHLTKLQENITIAIIYCNCKTTGNSNIVNNIVVIDYNLKPWLYLHISQFCKSQEKSDVRNFGIMLLELMTG